MIKISVIIPVYNTEQYLKQCLDSVFDQNFSDIEVICVNDGSPDNSLEILKQYPQIKLIDKANTGAGDSRNKGLDIASGEYVLFLDSDDFLEPDSLEKLYNKACSTDAEIIFFNVNKYYEENGRKNFYNYVEPYYREFKEEIFSPQNAKEILFQTTAHPFKMYKRDSLVKYEAKYSHNSLVEDQSLFYKCIANFDRVCVLNDCILNYRIHGKSITQKVSNYIDDMFDEFYLCEDIIKNSKHGEILMHEFLKNRILAMFYWFEKVENKKNFYTKLKQFLKHIRKNYGKYAFENCIEKEQIQSVLKLPFHFYQFNEKISIYLKTIATYLN